MNVRDFCLANPPAVHVLLQVRFSPIVDDFEHQFVGLEEELVRLGFPDHGEGEIQQAREKPGGPVLRSKRPFKLYLNSSRTNQILLLPDSLVVETSAYGTFKEFRSMIAKLLPPILACLGDRQLNRLGLRYINLVEPSPDRAFSDYLSTDLVGKAKEDNKTIGNYWQIGNYYKHVDGGLSLRSSRMPEQRLLPPGVQPVALVYPRDVEKSDENVVVLDIDRFQLLELPLSPSGILDSLELLNEDATRIFIDSITEFARAEWKEVKGGTG